MSALFFFKHKTAYEMRISDWSSDVCSSDLFFGQDLRDAISPTYNAQGIGRSVNTDRGLIYGAELESAGAFGSWGWQLDGTWQHTEDRSEVRATRGKPTRKSDG